MQATKDLSIPEKERYTYEDYRKLPEGAPYQLLSGHLVMAPAPSLRHQVVQSNLFHALSTFVRERQLGVLLSSPVDVRLSNEDVPQPDLVFVRTENQSMLGEQEIEGPPDLIAEILSPSTAYQDLTEKKRLYEQHGVPEYWVVDPESQTVEVFRNTDDGFVQHARVVETGTASSGLLEGFAIDLDDLFQT